ncbi:hypothetical protein [Thioalkalivibrio sp. ALE30]|uniref:hypothetical protein n=1 Tax=Thioalkalivibrio sp. ALE30 TaxID=1158181 RepID=UPI000368975C|nr:hypothetical protein [Thioalkalivibrio sp. ALE30]
MISLIPRLFQRAPALDPESRAWIHAIFDWAGNEPHLGPLLRKAHLVLPTAEHFPGQADNRQAMAQLVFDRVLEHAGLADGPFRLSHPGNLMDAPVPWDAMGTARAARSGATAQSARVGIPYDPELVSHSQALIAHFAREIALRLLATARQTPPALEGNEAHIAELLATRMGFGVMLANTAFQVRVNQCGACKGPSAEREAALSRDDLAYALGLFCRDQGIPPGRARAHLNTPLRPALRHALRDLARRDREVASGAA